jgi:DGQHR domain-containing protein
MSIIVEGLKEELESNGKSFPIFIAFISAEDLLKIAEVPAFLTTTPNEAIATNVLTPPIKEWQRPLDGDRVQRISDVFSSVGNIMPNPILLCENMSSESPNIKISQMKSGAGGIPINVWAIEFEDRVGRQAYPLWVLDGQHRIHGLAKSSQKGNKIPVVLLLEHSTQLYDAPMMAKIFAQVTTAAQPLDELHNEWLTFAFNLGTYDSSRNGKADDRIKAMSCVAKLCSTPILLGSKNPFFNKIKFNKSQSVKPSSGGFYYTCKELSDLIFKAYYNSTAATNKLSPIHLAEEIADVYMSLVNAVAAPQDKSVFFGGVVGKVDYAQRIMQDAFLVGVFSYLLNHNRPSLNSTTWDEILENLEFSKTDWNFTSWVKTLSGPVNSKSKQVAIRIFSEVFINTSLPPKTSNLTDYFKGSKSNISLIFSELTPSNRVSKVNRQILDLSRGDNSSISINPRVHVKINKKSSNIADIIVSDINAPPGRQIRYNLNNGIVLNKTDYSNPAELFFQISYYGGTEGEAILNIKF